MERESVTKFIVLLIFMVIIFLIGLVVGCIRGTVIINKCKNMPISEMLNDEECRKFYLGE